MSSAATILPCQSLCVDLLHPPLAVYVQTTEFGRCLLTDYVSLLSLHDVLLPVLCHSAGSGCVPLGNLGVLGPPKLEVWDLCGFKFLIWATPEYVTEPHQLYKLCFSLLGDAVL